MALYNTPYHNESLQDKHILVTGGAGFVGSNIVEYLIRFGAGKIRVLDNLLTGHLQNVQQFITNGQIEFFEGDITNLDTCRKACEGINLVCHQAALGSVPRSIASPEMTNAINVTGTMNIFLAAKDAGIKRIVYASSSSVYGDNPVLPKVEGDVGRPLSPYAVSKFSNELYAHAFSNCYGIEMIGLRYFNIFGPKQDPKGPYAAVIPLFIDKIMNGEEVLIDGDGMQTRDFTFVENAVQANIKALTIKYPTEKSAVFNIAVGENFSVKYLYEQIRELLNIQHKPSYREARIGDIRNSLADISKAKNLLGYNPSFRFNDGLKHTVSYFSEIINVQP